MGGWMIVNSSWTIKYSHMCVENEEAGVVSRWSEYYKNITQIYDATCETRVYAERVI